MRHFNCTLASLAAYFCAMNNFVAPHGFGTIKNHRSDQSPTGREFFFKVCKRKKKKKELEALLQICFLIKKKNVDLQIKSFCQQVENS